MSLLDDLTTKDKESREAVLKVALRQVHDQKLRKDLRDSISKIKEPTYSLTRTIKKWSIAASIIVLITAGIWIWDQSYASFDPNIYAQEVFEHPGLTKGDNTELYRQAVFAYNNKEWQNAIEFFSSIAPQTSESIFYTAMSQFYDKNYNSAITAYELLIRNPPLYSQEALWYLSLSHYYNGDFNEATSYLSSIKEEGWKYKEAQLLLEHLRTKK